MIESCGVCLICQGNSIIFFHKMNAKNNLEPCLSCFLFCKKVYSTLLLLFGNAKERLKNSASAFVFICSFEVIVFTIAGFFFIQQENI